MRVAPDDPPAVSSSSSRHRAKSQSSSSASAASSHHAALPPDPRVPSSHPNAAIGGSGAHGIGQRSTSGGSASSSTTDGGGRGGGWRRCLARMLARKPLAVVAAEEEDAEGKGLQRRLGLWDLLAIGVGGTVGSGVFVLSGAIANSETLPAGPSVTLAFLFAGLGCALSGLSFAELASRIHQDGSSYAYAYVTLGEAFAFVAGCCLTLEYGISSAAVARNWGDKLGAWIAHLKGEDPAALPPSLWRPAADGVNLYAGLIEAACLLIMLRGLSLSKLTVDVFTVAKLLLVLGMTCGGFVLYRPVNMKPFAPSGLRGVFRGSMRCFFGYLGYDEVCCLGGEAKNPATNIPLAVMGTIVGVTFLYVFAAWSLVGMQPYTDISAAAGFSEAFRGRGVRWAADTVAVGELITLPLVVLVSLLAQPRLQFAMAEDGLLPAVFARVDAGGNLFWGTLIAGLVGVVIAVFLPFAVLEDMISAGVLIAFNMTNTGLMLHRRQHPTRPSLPRWLALWFNVLALLAAFLWVKLPSPESAGGGDTDAGSNRFLPLQVLASLATVVPLAIMEKTCPDTSPGGPASTFRTPLVPWLPGLGAAFNWFLLAQLTWQGLWMVGWYVLASLLLYFAYGYRHSVGATSGWRDVLSASLRRHSRHASSLGSADPALLAGLLDDERAAATAPPTKGGPGAGPVGAGGQRRGQDGEAVAAAGEANAQLAGGSRQDDRGEGAREGEGVRVGSPAGNM